MKTKTPGPSRTAIAAQLAADVAAFDAMCAARPLKAPPLRLMPPVITAAQLELRHARKMGLAA